MIDLHLDGDGAWPELATLSPERVISLMASPPALGLAVLPHGTARGYPAVVLRIDLPDGRVLVTQTTLRLLLTAVRAMVARHGDPTLDGEV